MPSNYYSNPLAPHFRAADLNLHGLRKATGNLLKSKIHGICFSAYEEGQGPGTELELGQIRQRLAPVRPHVKWVRTFGCRQGNELIPVAAREMGLKTLVGVWLDDDREKNEEELAMGIAMAKEGLVDILAIGNEVMLRDEMSSSELVSYLERAKADAPGVPVGYVDAYFKFLQHPDVADACDVILANCYPFWEGYPIEHALVYMKDMYRQAQIAAKGKKVIISETGWPFMGSPDRGAQPSVENAFRYFLDAYQWAEQEGIDIFYFSAFDEAWKVEDEGDVGAFWGLWDKDGNAKYE